MADTHTAPQVPAGLQPIPALGGSVTEAQEALLSLLEPEEETPETEEAQPTEEEESQPEEEDESFEEESEEEEESVEEEEESEEVDGEEEGALYAVTVNGEEREVSLDELLSGYSRQSDYTRKTQELSSDRKQMEELAQKYNSELQQMQYERQQYMGNLEQILGNAAGEIDKFARIDWSTLKDTDPIEYVTKREEFREAQEKIQSIRNEQASAQQKFAQDTEKQKKLASDVKSFAMSQGFSEEELSSLIDHRSVLVLIKAAKYDKMHSSDVKTKKLKNKPRVIRSGKGQSTSSSNKSKRTAQMKRLQGTGHVDDASALLEDFIDI
jgi:hypothetical protein